MPHIVYVDRIFTLNFYAERTIILSLNDHLVTEKECFQKELEILFIGIAVDLYVFQRPLRIIQNNIFNIYLLIIAVQGGVLRLCF